MASSEFTSINLPGSNIRSTKKFFIEPLNEYKLIIPNKKKNKNLKPQRSCSFCWFLVNINKTYILIFGKN